MGSAGDAVSGLKVHLRKEARGPVIASEAAQGRDLADPMAELAFQAGWRRTGSPIALSELKARVRPIHRSERSADGRSCDGFSLEADWPPGETTSCSFGRAVLGGVAARIGRGLVGAGQLAEGTPYSFDLEVEESMIGPLDIDGASVIPALEERAIAPLLAASRAVAADHRQGLENEAYSVSSKGSAQSRRVVGQTTRDAGEPDRPRQATMGDHHPAFYTGRALRRAEQVSRRGAGASPPVESGGLLVGRLCWCPESQSLFCLIEDVLEAAQTEASTYALTFTDETWGRVERVLRARQRNPATRGQRLLGQCHGHNFLPYSTGETCDGCPAQGTCGLSTAYLSESDRRWCRAVFPREPWQLSHVFGLTPRRDPVSGFYGQRGSSLERRSYYVLEDDSD